jgi:lipoprotein-releasing system ATP-binding protein
LIGAAIGEGLTSLSNQGTLCLSVTGVRKSFRSDTFEVIEVLRGLSFSVSPGQTVAIVGPSGAGKSTLLQVLGGLEAVDAGSLMLGDFEISRAAGAELARFRNEMVGFVFQFHHLLPELNARENVAMPLLIRRIPRREAMGRAGSLLENMGLGQRLEHMVSRLSGGEQQRVALARALITKPPLILADEPTGNLDAETGAEIGKILLSFCRQNSAVGVIATHNKQLAACCDRILSLKNGILEAAVP